jgi:apolipoprotein N-acyltransferase
MKRAANDNRRERQVLAYYAERLQSLQGWFRRAALCLFGLLAVLALPPFHAWPLLWLAIPSVLWLFVSAPTGRVAFWDGWWFGFGFFVCGLYWFAYALLVDASKFGWLIPFAVFGISGILALYMGLLGWLTSQLRGHDRVSWLFAFPAIWMGVEWLRGFLFTGFPWNLIGYSFDASDIAIQAASLLGVYGLSWFTVLVASLPILFMPRIETASALRQNCMILAGCLVAFIAVLAWGQARLAHHPLSIVPNTMLRLVQPAIDQYHKSQPGQRQNILRRQIELTRSEGFEAVTHVIWPETAMPFFFSSGDYWAQELAQLVPPNGLLMTGFVRSETTPDQKALLRVFNSFAALDSGGNVVFSYDKRKLVPFGEFVPFRDILPLDKITPGSLDFSQGLQPGRYQPVQAQDFAFFPLICYEVTFPGLSQQAWPAALLNVTNDGWFGISTGPYQHLAMSRMRAVEQGVPMIRAANSGVSAVIDPYGRFIAQLGLGREGVLDAPLPASTAQPTLYARVAGQLEMLLLLITACSVIARHPQLSQKKKAS